MNNCKKVVRYDPAGKGIAKEMVRKVIGTAQEKNLLKMGFKYLETIKMFYADTGWTEFKLYEYVV